jgi:hypothetical protein
LLFPVFDIAFLVYLMTTSSYANMRFIILFEVKLRDEIGKIDVGDEMVVFLDLLLAVDAQIIRMRKLLACIVLLQH